MNKIYPEFLKQGSKIAIVSPSGSIDKEYVYFTEQYLISQGFQVEIYPSVFNKYFQFAGTDFERLTDLQRALDSPEIEAILCTRGGYGLIRIIDKLDFTKFLQKPKWIIGFSDITNLHLAINNLNICSIHSQMARAIYKNPESESVSDLIKVVKGSFQKYKIDSNELNRNGTVEAELVGGNLSIIYSLQGTKYEIDTDGKILFIEDLNEYLYHIDRMMINLKLSGKLSKLKGLVVGAFTKVKDNDNPFGKTVNQIISEHVAEYNYPVCFDFKVGHIEENYPLVVGLKYTLEINNKETILFPRF